MIHGSRNRKLASLRRIPKSSPKLDSIRSSPSHSPRRNNYVPSRESARPKQTRFLLKVRLDTPPCSRDDHARQGVVLTMQHARWSRWALLPLLRFTRGDLSSFISLLGLRGSIPFWEEVLRLERSRSSLVSDLHLLIIGIDGRVSEASLTPRRVQNGEVSNMSHSRCHLSSMCYPSFHGFVC